MAGRMSSPHPCTVSVGHCWVEIPRPRCTSYPKHYDWDIEAEMGEMTWTILRRVKLDGRNSAP